MGEAASLLRGLAAGVLLGTLFFGGLWLTIRRAMVSSGPALWFAGSLLLRTLLIVAGFYAVAHGDWRQLPACLLGFLIARLCVTGFVRARRGGRQAGPVGP